jgi:hypothetical protein
LLNHREPFHRETTRNAFGSADAVKKLLLGRHLKMTRVLFF